jgi:hypothetical protein
MTVQELIEYLKGYDPTLPVVVQGYEGGVADVKPEGITVIPIRLNVNTESYYGPHEHLWRSAGQQPDTLAVLLERDP